MLALTRRPTHKLTPNAPKNQYLAHLFSSLLIFLTTLGLTTLAFAAGPELEVKIIKATTGSTSKVDGSLGSMSQALSKSFPNFKDFKLLSEHRYTSQKGKVHMIQIKPKLKVKLRVKERAGGITLSTTVKNRKSKKGMTQARYGELFFQAFKWRGDALILAVTARQ